MGRCKDQSVTHLNTFGYNVVRLPIEGINPLQLIGRQGGTVSLLGRLEHLITEPEGDMPAVTRGLTAANIDGSNTSDMKVGIGLNILGTLIGALGGNLGVTAEFKRARRIRFQYAGVEADRALPIEIGQYLGAGDVDADNPLIAEYITGNGTMYVLTEVLRSNKLGVKATKKNGHALDVDVPVLQQAVGGNVAVTSAGESASTIMFEGKEKLAFGFKAFEIGLVGGELRLVTAKPSGDLAFMSAADGDDGEAVLAPASLLEIDMSKARS